MIFFMWWACQPKVHLQQQAADIRRMQKQIQKMEERIALLEESQQKDVRKQRIERIQSRKDRRAKLLQRGHSHHFIAKVNRLNLSGSTWDAKGPGEAPDLSLQTPVSAFLCKDSYICKTDALAIPSSVFYLRVFDQDENRSELIGKAQCDQILGTCKITGHSKMLTVEFLDPIVPIIEQKISPKTKHQFEISEGLVKIFQKHMDIFASQINLLAHRNENSQQDGYRLSSIKKGSIFHKLGLKNGDLLTQINEYPCKSTNVEQILVSIYQKQQISVQLKRNRQKIIFQYSLRPSTSAP